MRRAFLALPLLFLPSSAKADMCGAESQSDLYRALMVDSRRVQTACLLLRAAWDDPRVTYAQYKELRRDFRRNFK